MMRRRECLRLLKRERQSGATIEGKRITWGRGVFNPQTPFHLPPATKEEFKVLFYSV